MKILRLICVLIGGFSYIGHADQNANRVKAFHQMSMTRGWELGLWRIKNEREHDNSAKLFKLSMTAEAFRYWVLVREGLVDNSPVFEEQIRRSFSNGDLDASTLKNPLNRDSNNSGGFGVGFLLTAENYKILSREFEIKFTKLN